MKCLSDFEDLPKDVFYFNGDKLPPADAVRVSIISDDTVVACHGIYFFRGEPIKLEKGAEDAKLHAQNER